MLLRGIDQLLSMEGFDLSEISRAFTGYEMMQYTKTDGRSVLGNMDDLVKLYKHCILSDGGFGDCDLAGIMCRINRTPQRNPGVVEIH